MYLYAKCLQRSALQCVHYVNIYEKKLTIPIHNLNVNAGSATSMSGKAKNPISKTLLNISDDIFMSILRSSLEVGSTKDFSMQSGNQ